MPNLRNRLLGLGERVRIVLSRVGGSSLMLMVVLWFLASSPAPPAGASVPPIEYSISCLPGRWTLPMALAFLAWFVFAPQCLSTIAVTRRETNGWKWPAFMLGYLFVLAYVFAGLTYWTAIALGL